MVESLVDTMLVILTLLEFWNNCGGECMNFGQRLM